MHKKNPMSQYFGGVSASLIDSEKPYLQTSTGLQVELFLEHPAYDLLSKCSICITTVGANTAELGSFSCTNDCFLLPTQQLDAMRSWDGIPGLLANFTFNGFLVFAKLINWFFLRRKGLLAWPNIWAQKEIVPELVGKFTTARSWRYCDRLFAKSSQISGYACKFEECEG